MWFKKKEDLSAFKTQSSNNIMHTITISQKKLFVNLYKEKKMYTYIYIFVFLEIVLILHRNNFLNDK